MNQDDVAAELENYLRMIDEEDRAGVALDRDLHLFESGYLNSLSGIGLITFVESHFGVVLTDEQLFGPEFSTINRISGLVLGGLEKADGAQGSW